MMPMDLPIFFGSPISPTRAMIIGAIKAAPNPWINRNPTMSSKFGAHTERKPPKAYIPNPKSRVLRVSKITAIGPAKSWKTTKGTM
jgi:hypothetical protein